MRNTAERVVTDLVAAGLVERHRAVEAERVVTRSLEPEEPLPAGEPPARRGARTMLVEIAGYVGSALVLASVGLLLAQLWDGFSETLQVAILAMVAVLLAGAGVAVSKVGGGYAELAAGRDEMRRRLASTLLTAAALAAAVAVGQQGYLVVDDSSSPVPAVLAGLTMLGLGAVGYRYAHSALGLLAIVGAVVQVVVVTAAEDGSALATGIVLVVVSAAWLALTELTTLFRERVVARSLGVTLALVGAQVVLFDGGHDNVAYALTVGVAAAGFVLYLRTAAWPYLVVGVLGITLVVPEAVMGWTDNALGPAGGVLVAGLTLLGASLAGLRMRQEVAEQGAEEPRAEAPADR
ncbi:MAG TPA: hypothetical protein VFG72_08180 [Marmoricola sp.]|nr:hypothetical protein [Marmoricola sp.]